MEEVYRLIGTLLQPVAGILGWILIPWKPAYKKIELPSGSPSIICKEAEREVLDRAIHSLKLQCMKWRLLKLSEKASLLRRFSEEASKASKEFADIAVRVKGTYGNGLGEELSAWVPVIWLARNLAETLECGGEHPINSLRQRKDGQFIVEVFPQRLESIFFAGMRGEIWIEPGKLPTQGAACRSRAPAPEACDKVTLVLGAGNHLSVVAADILYNLITENAVVICKLNPILDYSASSLRRAFAPFIEEGYLEFVHGGSIVGDYLCQHSDIGRVHMTGSSATFDAIVWGRDNPKKVGPPLLQKAIAAELGCVTPIIVVPGKWSHADLEYYAKEVVAGLVVNAGHICLKPEVIIADAAWPQRTEFVNAIRQELSRTPRRTAWYPGSTEKWAAFHHNFPHAEKLGTSLDDDVIKGQTTYLPWLLQSGLHPEEAILNIENWCGVLQEVGLPATGGDPLKFLDAAQDFANERCWGSLSCAAFIPSSILKAHANEVEDFVAGLKYGNINVNVVPLLGCTIPSLVWGAFPGNAPENIGSGNCFVHNSFMIDHPQKSVLWAPWRIYPTHVWSPANRTMEEVVAASMFFVKSPSLSTFIYPALVSLLG